MHPLLESPAVKRAAVVVASLAVLSGAAILAAACGSASGSGFGGPEVDSGGAGTDGGAPHDSAVSVFDVQTFGDGNTAGEDTGTPGKTIAYAHDGTTLYTVDPTSATYASTLVGKFDCVGGSGQQSSMTDIAVDKDGNLYGLATSTLYLQMTISGGAVHCTAGAVTLQAGASTDGKFYGMSFAPAGTLDPTNETLVVGNTDGQLYSVDTTTGALTLLGNFGTVPAADGYNNTYPYPGGLWEMSGDIVFLANNGNPIGFATVRDCKSPPSSSTCDATDSLVQIDIAGLKAGTANSVQLRGQILKDTGCADTTPKYGAMYGVAAFEDKIIGFGYSGFTVSIDNNTGTACALASGTPKWAGAGVTTTAPVVAPPPPPPPK